VELTPKREAEIDELVHQACEDAPEPDPLSRAVLDLKAALVVERAESAKARLSLATAEKERDEALSATADWRERMVKREVELEMQEHDAKLESVTQERDALVETLSKLEDFLRPFRPKDAHTTPRWKSLPERPAVQDMATWVVEQATLLLRNELQHGPPDKRNRMTVAISWADEDWNLTLSIGKYEHAVEKARDEARLAVERLHQELALVEAERDELRATVAANQKA
jgi:hypothetical protein